MIVRRFARNGPRWALVSCGALLLLASGASAQHADDYESEDYTASADGTPITGQPAGAKNQYYIPVEDSDDGLLYTYADNALGIPQNPNGGSNFVGSTGDDPVNDPVPFSRAQRDVGWQPIGPLGTVKVAYDILVTKIGDPLTNQNVGSWSSQLVPEGGGTPQFGHIDLVTWVDPNDATQGWNGNEVWFNAGGGQLNEQIPELSGLQNDRWYRRSHTYNLETNQITKLAVVDLETGEQFVHDSLDRYSRGGAAGGQVPTGFRYFAGCSTGNCSPGNTIAWDNVIITCPEDLDDDGDVGFSDLLRLLARWGPCAGGCLEDLDGDQDVGFSDLLKLLARWGSCM